MVGACYAGPPENGAEVVRPLKEFGNPIVDRLEPAVRGAAVDVRPLVPHGWHRYWKSVELPLPTDRRSTRSSTAPRGSRRHARTPFSSSSAGRSVACQRMRPPSASATPRTTSSSTPSGRTTTPRATGTWPGRAISSTPCSRTRATASTSTSWATRTRPRSAGLRHREVRPAGRTQTQLRSNKLLPPQSEHPARLTVRQAWRGKEPGGGSPILGESRSDQPSAHLWSAVALAPKSRAKDAVLPPDGMSDEWRREAAVQELERVMWRVGVLTATAHELVEDMEEPGSELSPRPPVLSTRASWPKVDVHERQRELCLRVRGSRPPRWWHPSSARTRSS